MLWFYIAVLLPAGVLAGMVSAAAGLASLVSYPALLAVGLPPILANVTNTVSLVFADVGSVSTSGRELRGRKQDMLRLLPFTAAGSICGGLLLLLLPSSSFERVVPFFILLAAVLILFPNLLRVHKEENGALPARRRSIIRVAYGLMIFLVGAYTGYFGAGGGVIMLALLTATIPGKFAECNALKNVSLGAANLVAALLFIFRTHVDWLAAVPLAVGFYIGGAIGPSIVRRVPAKWMRRVIAAGATGLAVYLFIQAYFMQA